MPSVISAIMQSQEPLSLGGTFPMDPSAESGTSARPGAQRHAISAHLRQGFFVQLETKTRTHFCLAKVDFSI